MLMFYVQMHAAWKLERLRLALPCCSGVAADLEAGEVHACIHGYLRIHPLHLLHLPDAKAASYSSIVGSHQRLGRRHTNIYTDGLLVW